MLVPVNPISYWVSNQFGLEHCLKKNQTINLQFKLQKCDRQEVCDPLILCRKLSSSLMSSTLNREANAFNSFSLLVSFISPNAQLCGPFFFFHIVRAQSWFCFTWFHIWKLKWESHFSNWRWSLQGGWPCWTPPWRLRAIWFMSLLQRFSPHFQVFLNLFPQSVRVYGHKTYDFHLKLVTSQCSLSGLLNSALTQRLYLKCWATMKVLTDFVAASVAYNWLTVECNTLLFWRKEKRLINVFGPFISIWYLFSD